MKRRPILLALALGAALAGCGSAAASSPPAQITPPTFTPRATVPPVCTSSLQSGCVPPLCSIIGNVRGCIPDGPNYQGPTPPQPVYGTDYGNGNTWCVSNCDPSEGSS